VWFLLITTHDFSPLIAGDTQHHSVQCSCIEIYLGRVHTCVESPMRTHISPNEPPAKFSVEVHRQKRPRVPARENNLGSKTHQSSHPCDGPGKKGGPIAVMTPTERGLARCQIPIRPSPRGREVLTICSSRTTGARRPGGVRFAGCATLEMGRVWVWVCVMISSFPFRQAILW
jgi:hypothetical protein